MKALLSKILFVGVAAVLFASCQKEDVKAVVNDPSTVTLAMSSSSDNVVLDSAHASTVTAETISWNAADFGAKLSVSYTLQVDSAKGDFSHAQEVLLGSQLTTSYTKKALNDLVTSLKLVPGKAGQIKTRVKADVGSGLAPVYSNTGTITVTPYSTKPTPKYPVPAGLFLVGDASPSGWDNPVATPSQQFTKLDDNTFGLVIHLTGGKQYLLLPKNGDWSHKYAVPGTPDAAGGDFVPDAANNIPGPAADGTYKIIVDFVKGTYAVTAVTSNPVPPNLYIVGDATPGGWNNPVPTPSQQFTQVSNAEFTITVSLSSTGSYLFLPLNGDWGHKFGGTAATGGTILADGNVPGANTPAPASAGTYTIDANFLSGIYTVTKQ